MTPPECAGGHSDGAPRADPLSPPILAFDFDGTLTVRDSFTAFLRWRTTRIGWMLGLLRLVPAALVYVVRRDRGRLKAASLRVFLQGLARADLEAEAEAFAAANFDRLMRPDALAAWRARAGCMARRVIVTASPEQVVAPFARRLEASELIASRLSWSLETVGPGLEGLNCRGIEKVRRLEARYGPQLDVREAFGDTAGDREMLAIADVAHMRVFTGRPGRRRS